MRTFATAVVLASTLSGGVLIGSFITRGPIGRGTVAAAKPQATLPESVGEADAGVSVEGESATDPSCEPGAPSEHSAGCLAFADGERAARELMTTYRAAEFRALVIGKSKKEIIATLGRPIGVDDGMAPGSQTYDYSPAETYKGVVSFRVSDEATGLEQKFVSIHFDPLGNVEGVQF
jgi:hypothetical protein